MNRRLHPDLARVAVAYDDIVERHSRGAITAAEAQRAIDSLVARDDNGVQWKVDSLTGRWKFKDASGSYSFGQPPESGLAGLTPWQLGAGHGADPDDRILMQEISSPAAGGESRSGRAGSSRAWLAALLLLLAVAAFVLLWP